MKRIVVSLIGSQLVPIGYWLAGYDFAERGLFAFFCYITTIFVAAVIYSYPGWSESQYK